MSTVARRAAPRIVKPKPQPQKKALEPLPVAEQPSTATVVTTATDVPVTAEAPQQVVEQQVAVQAPPSTQSAAENTSAEAQYCGFIPPARVRNYLDKYTMNKLINDEYDTMKSKLNALKAATEALQSGQVKVHVKTTVDGKDTFSEVARDITPEERAAFEATVTEVTPLANEYKFKMDALSRERERFSSEAPVVLSAVCDEIVKQLMTHAIEHTLKKNKKIILVSHMHSAGIEKLSLYRLICNLPSFKRNAEFYSQKEDSEELAKLHKKIRNETWSEYRKLYNMTLARKQKEQKPKRGQLANDATTPAATTSTPALPLKAPELPAEQATEEVEDDAEDAAGAAAVAGDVNKTSFVYHILGECKALTAKYAAQHGKLRISTGIKHYLSDLLIEFIKRMGTLIHLTTSTMTRKTVNGNAILRTIEKLLVDGHEPVEKLEFVPAEVPDPDRKAEELKKKEAAKAAGTEYKVDLKSLPKVSGYLAVKTVRYPTSGFEELQAAVNEKLKHYREANAPTSAPAQVTSVTSQ